MSAVIEMNDAQIIEYIDKLLASSKEQTTIPLGPAFSCVLRDYVQSIPDLEKIIKQYHEKPHDTYWKELAVVFLKNRWKWIGNTPICYTLNRDNPINEICINLAKLVNRSRFMSLLMPRIIQEDTLHNEFNDMTFGEFIIADDKIHFITVIDLFQSAVLNIIKNEPYIFQIFDTSQNKLRPLSRSELNRIGPHVQELLNLQTRYNLSKKEASLVEMLWDLQKGLELGDKNHEGGSEFEAGDAAYAAITRFREFYWETLTPNERKKLDLISSSGTSLSNIFEIIFHTYQEKKSNGQSLQKNNEPPPTEHCILLRGRELETILIQRAGSIANIKPNKRVTPLDSFKNEFGQFQKIKTNRPMIKPQPEQQRVMDEKNLACCLEIIQKSLNTSKNTSKTTYNFLQPAELLTSIAHLLSLEIPRYLHSGAFMNQDLHQQKINNSANLLIAIAHDAKDFKATSKIEQGTVAMETLCRSYDIAQKSRSYFSFFSEPDSVETWEKCYGPWLPALRKFYPQNALNTATVATSIPERRSLWEREAPMEEGSPSAASSSYVYSSACKLARP